MQRAFGILAASFLLLVSSASWAKPETQTPLEAWTLVHSLPHDHRDFTQGLVWVGERLFESAGNYGASNIAEKNPKTGKAIRRKALPAKQFAEGLTVHGNELWQLTWREGLAHVYDLDLKPLRSYRYGGQGWGLTSNETELIASNGSDRLFFIDPTRFAVTRFVQVTDQGAGVAQLNELEWVDGFIYANVWHSNRVAKIDPATGTVLAWLDLSPLVKSVKGLAAEDVLNGLAYQREQKLLYVTGKHWPKLFAIRLQPNP